MFRADFLTRWQETVSSQTFISSSSFFLFVLLKDKTSLSFFATEELHSLAHAQARLHADTHTLTRTPTHTLPRTPTHTFARTHTLTHLQAQTPCSLSFIPCSLSHTISKSAVSTSPSLTTFPPLSLSLPLPSRPSRFTSIVPKCRFWQ